MRGTVRALANALLVAVMVCSLDLHLPLLQVAAWSGMFIRNARTDSLASALTKTFDGEHPCRLCCAIRAAKQRPAVSITAAPCPGSDLIAPQRDTRVAPPAVQDLASAEAPASPESSLYPPPVPPPRA